MSRRVKTQSIRCVRLGPRRTLPSAAFSDTKRGRGRFVTCPRSCAAAQNGKVIAIDIAKNVWDSLIISRFLPVLASRVLVHRPFLRHHGIKVRLMEDQGDV